MESEFQIQMIQRPSSQTKKKIFKNQTMHSVTRQEKFIPTAFNPSNSAWTQYKHSYYGKWVDTKTEKWFKAICKVFSLNLITSYLNTLM